MTVSCQAQNHEWPGLNIRRSSLQGRVHTHSGLADLDMIAFWLAQNLA